LAPRNTTQANNNIDKSTAQFNGYFIVLNMAEIKTRKVIATKKLFTSVSSSLQKYPYKFFINSPL
jgi:hypothetical protein